MITHYKGQVYDLQTAADVKRLQRIIQIEQWRSRAGQHLAAIVLVTGWIGFILYCLVSGF
jgi:hypothetical protein